MKRGRKEGRKEGRTDGAFESEYDVYSSAKELNKQPASRDKYWEFVVRRCPRN
jgi:hypothetical protein